jgi:hypothetical protein
LQELRFKTGSATIANVWTNFITSGPAMLWVVPRYGLSNNQNTPESMAFFHTMLSGCF